MTHRPSPGCLSRRNSHQIHAEIAHYSIVCGALEMKLVSLTRTAEVRCGGGTAWVTLRQLYSSRLLPENKLDGYSNQCEQSNRECTMEHNITHLNKSPSIWDNIKFIECKNTYMENIRMFAFLSQEIINTNYLFPKEYSHSPLSPDIIFKCFSFLIRI